MIKISNGVFSEKIPEGVRSSPILTKVPLLALLSLIKP